MYRFILMTFILFLNSCQEPITNSGFCNEDDIDSPKHFLDKCNPESYSKWRTKAPPAQCQSFSKCLSKAAKNSYPDFLNNLPEQSISSYEEARGFIEYEKKLRREYYFLEPDTDKGLIIARVNNICGELASTSDLIENIWGNYDVKWEEAAEINNHIDGNYNRCMCYLTDLHGLANWSHGNDVVCKDGQVIRESSFQW
tara:strand:+ start:1097 stop:1690 length:594 start_codon:yes stop_codon:yes gene_type:complete